MSTGTEKQSSETKCRLPKQLLGSRARTSTNGKKYFSMKNSAYSDTVILETPARKAAAPTMANIRGEMLGISCPIKRPKSAPASRAGMIIPEGTPRGYFTAEGDDSQDQLDQSSVNQPAIITALILKGFLGAHP